MKFPFFLVLVFFLVDVHGIVFSPEIRECCSSKIGEEAVKCLINGATNSLDGSVHLAVKGNQYIRVEGIRHNGFPIVNLGQYPIAINQAFPGVQINEVIEMIRLSNDKMLIIGPEVALEFDERSNIMVKRHPYSCTQETHNLFCNKIGSIYAMMWLKNNLYWANIRMNNGSFKTILLSNSRVITERLDKSGRSSQAIVLYNTDSNGNAYGYDFLTEGRALPFVIKLPKQGNPNPTKLSVRAAEVSEKHPGLENKLFWGCPQSFCWHTDFDAGMTVGETTLVVFRGNYYWELPFPLTSLPFQTPKNPKQLNIQGIPFVDAATELSDPRKGYLLFKDTQVFLIKSLTDKTASKTWNLEVFLFGNDKNRGFEYIDSAWFNHEENTLFLFKDDLYFQMKQDDDDGSFRMIGNDYGRKIIVEFKIFSKDIDAAFSMQGSGIFVKRNWFYDLPERDWKQPSAGYAASLSLGSKKNSVGLFDTKESCNMTDQQFRLLTNRMEAEFGLVDAKEEGRFIKTNRRLKAEIERTGSADDILGETNRTTLTGLTDIAHDTAVWVWPVVFVVLVIMVILIIVLGIIYSKDAKKKKDLQHLIDS